MDTLSFLRLILPVGGTYLLAEPKSYTKDGETIPYFKHYPYTTLEHMAYSAQVMASQGVSVYFALASVKEDYTQLNAAQRAELGVKVRGQHKNGHDNTNSVRAFWVDLDVKPDDPRCYASQVDAAAALRGFVQSLGLPKPFVTSSGGGFHAYWPLDHDIDPETWQVHASILKALTVAWGLKADPSRTADRASVLRPVGTYNWKTGEPRPVELVLAGSVTSADALLHRLQTLKAQTGVQVPDRRHADHVQAQLGDLPAHLIPAANINTEAAEGAGQPAPKASAVVKRCPHLLWQKNNPAAVPEPAWYAMIGCLRHAEGGAKAVHLMSQGHPGYSQARTDDKLIQAENSGTGPTLCSTFALHTPELCQNCAFYGRIKTPLQAGRVAEPLPPPTVEVEQPNGEVATVTLPPPPKPFKRVIAEGAVAGHIAIEVDTENGATIDEVIYEFDLYPVKQVLDERTGEYCVTVRLWLPHEGWAERSIPTGKFYDRRQLAVTLGNYGIMVNPSNVDEVVSYMVAYIRELQKHSAASVVYSQLGWRDGKDLFVLPNCVVTPQGRQTVEPSKNIVNALNWVPAQGDLQEWKKIVAIYERPGLEALQFGFGTSFAAPLFKFTNFTGAIVSLVGKRGSGKSSAALCANSVWGHKKMGWLDMENDTRIGFYNKLGALNNVLATYDEITNLSGELVSQLAYAITKGQGRQRATQSGEAAANHANWNTMLLATSNFSLHSKLASEKTDASAEASRVFEYTVPSGTLPKHEADETFDKLNDHYGLAGPVYAQALVNRREWARDRVLHWIKTVDHAAGTGSSERFWSAVVATVLTGFELANDAGLTNANIERLFKFAVKQIGQMRGVVTENTRTAESLVADYINSNLRSMLAVNSDKVGSTNALVTIAPSSDRLRIRLERHRNRLYLDRADFRRFLADRGADTRQVQNELRDNGVLIADNTKCVLGKGTVYSGGQTICWVIDFAAPALSGTVASVDAGEREQQEAAV